MEHPLTFIFVLLRQNESLFKSCPASPILFTISGGRNTAFCTEMIMVWMIGWNIHTLWQLIK